MILKTKRIKKIAFVFMTLVFLTGIVGFLLAYIPAHMSEKHTNDIVKIYYQDVGYTTDTFNSTWLNQIQSYELTAEQGYTIPVYYICPNEVYENKTIILVHWHESNHTVMYPIAEVFAKQGWNVVLYDQRAHGKNTAKTVTFGYLESVDLQQVVDFVFEKSNGAMIGALGQSMGAATIAYYSGTKHANQCLDFAIIDSAYSSMEDEIYSEISKQKIPLPAKALTSLGSGFCKLIYGYSFSDVDIIKQVKSNNSLTLVMHSKCDGKCPYYMGEQIFNAIPHDSKRLITYEESDHLFSFWDEKERYCEEIFLFMDEYLN
ncbi:alpha/beta hydrolase [Anaerovorax sp. IOR16]|uniref:alpha/beta hydrolase n=1 Tax=Anaerovorax sp. IOR16 TaxID=2773458 RepID=UPI0019D2C253|nr:alpha/beta fold hydrolase [Anaerovorax sp. IOR16]